MGADCMADWRRVLLLPQVQVVPEASKRWPAYL